ncbi:HAMP domain-containing histidine kinase [Ectothiorhodospiraceae bacterium WFHF3C12]|nr:HAMP domain-containing histidine kinase [Ectothiorhodospiraceae bacterium WFHF3C12]
MLRFQPRSTVRLTLYGFAVVALPLLAALVYSAFYVDRLVNQAQTAVYDAAQTIQVSRLMAEQVTTMERHARQSLVLDDESLLEAYARTHEEFQANGRRMLEFAADAPFHEVVLTLMDRARSLYEQVSQAENPALSQEEVAKRFAEFHETVEAIQAGSNRYIDQQVQVMQERAADAQTLLAWFAVASVPLTLISTGLFTVIIARPLNQMDRVIRQLGDARFDEPIAVSGPQDLQALGERLDWLRQRLQELEDQKSRFLRHMSHELKTPLTAIRESSELLSDGVVGELNAEQQEIAEILHSSSRRLQSLIEDLLDFAMLQYGRPRLRLREFEARPLIEEIIRSHRPAMRAKNISLRGRADGTTLVGDREKLRTVVDNLLSNAIKFTPQAGRIYLRLRALEDRVEIEVADSGPGIPPAEADSVFDAFFQGEKQPVGYVKGSGLGLSIAREYVEAHRGTITLLTDTDWGAHFKVTLPRGVQIDDNGE